MIPWDTENFMFLVKEAAAAKYFFGFFLQKAICGYPEEEGTPFVAFISDGT